MILERDIVRLISLNDSQLISLKIDQSFMSEGTHDLNDQTIIKTIILMAQLLKLQVIAEGVETNDQVTFLLRHGCVEVFLPLSISTSDQFHIIIRVLILNGVEGSE